METPSWQRRVARVLLVTFTTVAVACGSGSQSQTPPTTSTDADATTTTGTPPTAGTPTTAAAPPSTLPEQPPPQLGKQELRDLVAPVALYPDVVLASLLPATTYPDQLHDAAEWLGDAQRAEQVPEDRDWDGSVVALLQFPDVLRWLDDNPAWTDQMGQAVTYQQADVLAAIQDYRRAVREAGNLKSNQYQTVRAAPNDNIRIEPARKDVVYVPSYDADAATQPQPEQEKSGINPWIAFGAGAVVGALGAWALYSIFDDDDDDDHDHYRYGGARRIRRYDNYYYAGGRRRPRPVDWAPRRRVVRAGTKGVARPKRLEHRPPAATPGKPVKVLSPPTKAAAAQPQRPGAVRREQRQERRQQQQQQRQERQLQRQEQKQEQRGQRQERKQQRREQRREPQPQRQQRQEQRQEKREQRQEGQQEQRQQRQEQREQREQQQQEQRQQRQENRQQMRQERQQNRAERRGADGQGGQKANAKKKKKQQQRNQAD